MDNEPALAEGPRRVDLGRSEFVWVSGAGQRVVLLHGWGLQPPIFRTTIERLAHRGFQVAAPGLAVVGRRWDLDRAIHRVEKTLDALEWDDATVVGYSLGGAVAAGFTAASPERVKLLALVNSVGLRIDRGMLGWALPIARYALPSNLPAMRAVGRNALRIGGLQNLADAALYARLAHLEVEFARIRQHRTPAVVLWSANDRLLPVRMGREIADALGTAIHVVPSADHDWPVRAPELFARELDLLLRSSIQARRRKVSERRPRRVGRLDRP